MRDRRLNDERGASLVIALVFIAVFGLLLGALMEFGGTSAMGNSAYRDQRAVNYAADGALDAAVNRVQHQTDLGVDPNLIPNPADDACNPANNRTILQRPAEGNSPKVVVSCRVVAGSNSGEPGDLGSPPQYSLLTLGDRRTDTADGAVNESLVGVRNTQPGPYNGNVKGSVLWIFPTDDPCSSARQEMGMRVNKTAYPAALLGGLITKCAEFPRTFAWNVQGDVFSNSKIFVDQANAVPTMIANPTTPSTSGTIKARGGCFGTGFGGAGSPTNCTDAGWNLADGQGRDPGLDPDPAKAALWAPRDLKKPDGSPLPVVSTLPPASDCMNARHLVTFTPGIYRSAKALNDLFGDTRCKNATFWFKPDDNGTPDDPTDDNGVFYFDFTNADTSYQCGTDQSLGLFDPTGVTQNTVHQWCVGGKANDFGGQRVIGGTPYNWDPTLTPTNRTITLEATKAGAGPGTFFGLFPQPTLFVKGDDCSSSDSVSSCGSVIDTKTVNYAYGSGRTGSSIWLSGFPSVPRGSYNQGIDLQISYAAVNGTNLNAPTVEVNYTYIGNFGLKSTGSCGTFTLPKPPANGSLQTVTLSSVSAVDAAKLSACLNTGDKINSAVVRYSTNRSGLQSVPSSTVAKFNGAKLLVTAQDAPTFPRPPTTEDAGGDCDPKGNGVQFIFGGDSRVYVPNGGLELCAGPNPANPLQGQQIALYGVPATPRLVPSSVTGGTNPANAKIIGEGSGLVSATMTANGNMILSYPGYAVPSGYSVGKVELRASYESPGSAPTVSLQNGSGTSYCNVSGLGNTGGSGIQGRVVDVTSCLTSARLGDAFLVSWKGGTCSGSNCPKLDGVEFIVTLNPNDQNTTLRPQKDCITSSPNYWYGTGTPDCAVVRVDGPIDTDGTLLGGIFGGIEKRGRLSVKGAIYAPSSTVDIDDEDVWYPIATRGITARHLRIRGFKYHDGYNEPSFSNWVDTSLGARQVVLLACTKDSGYCGPDDPTLVGRAAVSYGEKTSKPLIEGWAVGRL